MPHRSAGREEEAEEEQAPPPGRPHGCLPPHRDVVVDLRLQLLQVGLEVLGLVVQILDILEAL